MSQQGVWLYTVIQGPKLMEALPFYSCPSGVHGPLSLPLGEQQEESCIDLLLPWPKRKTHYLPHSLLAMTTYLALQTQRKLGHARGT